MISSEKCLFIDNFELFDLSKKQKSGGNLYVHEIWLPGRY